MEISVAELVAALKSLRKGRGIESADVDSRVAPPLRRLVGIEDGDGPAQVRRRLRDWLTAQSRGLPEDLKAAASLAFGLDGDARLYQERVRSVALRIDRDDRTARRRIDDALLRIAQRALDPDVRRPVPDLPWRTAELSAVVVLDLPVPEVVERRRIVAEQDGLTEVELSVTLEPPDPGRGPLGDVGLDVLYGGVLTNRARKSTNRIGFALRLPEPLRRNDEHEYSFRIKLSPERGIAPYYVCTPRFPCALFRLHVRFGPGRAPGAIWRLQDTLPIELNDPESSREPVTADASGEVHLSFADLKPNLSYGITWHDAGG
ncbi:hypothetical protein ALI22I_30990 [Saccharothrix sp. ALI-22-I]|uniref:hypothetical protein n=1 Tax=Saccharothrix sp. ALI-22-I TaxID=1933778 RepID=UPI00097C873C|nr:hypothetical protein [Saccharothrix sp. ALI-22-I]ONI84896.1 hypothetical protein ALI22I_30990 [Saccharothrix sp. ALI-22-I]